MTIFLLAIGIGLIKPSVALAGPHLSLSPVSGIITSEGTAITVQVDTSGQAAKSAKAVINFTSTLLEVTSIQAGTFFDDVSHNIYNSSGQVVINANLSLESMLESKTGSGILATMTVAAKSASGSAAITFDCTTGSSTDSNINDPTPIDIIVCADNVNGNYTLGGTATASAFPSATPQAVVSPDTGLGGDEYSPAPIPVTGTSWPTVALLVVGLVLIFNPVLSKILVNGKNK